MKKPRRATSGQGVPAMRLIKPPPVGNTFTFRAATTHTHADPCQSAGSTSNSESSTTVQTSGVFSAAFWDPEASCLIRGLNCFCTLSN